MKKIEHLGEDNIINFFTDEMKKSGKIMVMKHRFNGNIEYMHLAGDIPDKINELVDTVNMLCAYIEQNER